MEFIKTIGIMLLLLIILAVFVAYWYAAIAVAVVSLVYLVATAINKAKTVAKDL